MGVRLIVVPVFNPQTRHALELSRIAGDQRHVVRQRGASYEQVIRADRLTQASEVGTKLPRMRGRGSIQIQQLAAFLNAIEKFTQEVGVCRFGQSEFDFKNGNAAERQRLWRDPGYVLAALSGTFECVQQNVGVKKEIGHLAARSL